MKSNLRDSLVDDDTIARGRKILESEAEAILLKSRNLDRSFALLVEKILACDGHVVLSGVGKSGIVGEKIAATLSSTGTPALFLRPVEALHGDLGTVSRRDLILAISASGETTEVLAVVRAARELGVEVLALTGDLDSTLGRVASIALDVGVEREACPLDLAPTSSTTVTLAVGDALAMVLLERRGFTRERFLKFHPGGALGERLRFLVRDLMRSGEDLPQVEESDTLRRAIDEMTARDNVGMTLVTGPSGELTGILTDGVLRRALRAHAGDSHLDMPVSKYMGRRPRVAEPDASAAEALRIMEVHGITSLAVVDDRGVPIGVLHLHDILGRGQFRL